jgi:hypothetical protein
MDPLTQRLVVAQELVAGLLQLVPAYQHGPAQQLLDAAAARLKLLDAQQQSTQPPLVAPSLVPPGTKVTTP